MTTLKGTVAFRDIEFGVWVLRGDDGKTYQLAGGDRQLKKEGLRIEATGSVRGDLVTAAMVGPVFQVDSYRVL
jgi:hypothetical protein